MNAKGKNGNVFQYYNLLLLLLTGYMIVISILLLPLLFPSSQPTAPPIAGTQTSISAEIPPTEESYSREEKARKTFETALHTGIRFYDEGEYHQSAYFFHLAETINPVSAEPKYHLMLCYLQLEDRPFSEKSLAYNYAINLKILDPHGVYAQEAQEVIDRSEKESHAVAQAPLGEIQEPRIVADKPEPPVEDNKNPSIEYPSPVENKMPRLSYDYPQREPVRKEKGEENLMVEKAKVKEETEIDKNSSSGVTLTGTVSRPDESNKIFNVQGENLMLVSLTGDQVYKTVSDSKGYFEFKDVKPARDYVLVCVNRYTYTRYVREYYYISNPYNRKTSPGYVIINYPGNVQLKTTLTEKNNSSMGIGSFTSSTGIATDSGSYSYSSSNSGIYYSGGSVYYFPSGGYYYPSSGVYPDYYEYSRPVEVEYYLSWHIALDLNDAGVYKIDLNNNNSDKKFCEDYYPKYSAVTRKPYKSLSEGNPIKINQ